MVPKRPWWVITKFGRSLWGRIIRRERVDRAQRRREKRRREAEAASPREQARLRMLEAREAAEEKRQELLRIESEWHKWEKMLPHYMQKHADEPQTRALQARIKNLQSDHSKVHTEYQRLRAERDRLADEYYQHTPLGKDRQ